jgi:hypothetical protein
MARTKQTARKSTPGAAPRKGLAVNPARQSHFPSDEDGEEEYDDWYDDEEEYDSEDYESSIIPDTIRKYFGLDSCPSLLQVCAT